MKSKPLFTIGIIYSSLSAIVLPILLFMQLFSIFFFDNPGKSLAPYFLAIAILLIPIILIVGNITMWFGIKNQKTTLAIISMIIPVVYPIAFFVVWGCISP